MRIHIITAVEIGRVWGRGWRRAACKLYVEGSERGFVCSLIPGGHLQYSIGEQLALYYFSVSLTGFFFFFFFSGYFEKGKAKNELFNMGGYPFSFEPHIQFLSFSNGKHTFVIIHCSQHTFPNVSRLLFFFFLTCRYHLLKLDLAFT